MRSIARILLAVRDPESRRQRGIDKAVSLARQLSASLELFHAISTPVYLDPQPSNESVLADIKRRLLVRCQRQLEAHITRADTRGVDVSSSVQWDYPPHEAIVRRAKRIGADLIIAECHQGRRGKPWLMHLTDWELMRASAAPVLLLENTHRYRRRPVILAAVDPAHAHSKPSRLDDELVRQGQRWARTLSGSLHLMHASHPSLFGMPIADSAMDAAGLEATYELQLRKSTKVFEAFATRAKIPRARRHLVEGNPTLLIPVLARKLRADIVVMGAVSRSGLKRVLIGNTAERVLSDLPCDLLVVKPRTFAPRVAGKSRGLRVRVPPV
jgi:universal stress protein E